MQSWVESFNFTKEQIEQWTQQLPKGKSVVRWALENNKIPAEMFLLWAKKNYQLPVLNDTFTDLKTATEIKDRYSNIWPDHVAPIKEWDGTLFLACLEPVEGFKSPQNHQWVLAPLSMILKLRGETQPAVAQAVPILQDAPAGLKIDAAASVSFGGLSLDGPVGLEAPAGLNLAPPKHEVMEPTTRIIDAPAGLNFNFAAPSMASTPPPIPTPIIPMPTNATVPVAPPVPNAAPPSIGHMTEDGIRGFEDVGQYFLSEMSKYFEKSMILLFNQERLEPWKFSPGWVRDNTRSASVDLSGASMFRIVNETKNSYHGHIVPNSINEAFFLAWDAGKYPEHITITPVLIGKNMGGMILGVCTKAKGSSLSLIAIERLAEKVGELLVRWGPAKAA